MSLWFFLELSTLCFLFIMGSSYSFFLHKETLKLFLIQALSGAILLALILLSETGDTTSFTSLLYLVTLFKMGAVPFHSWLMSLSVLMTWDNLFIFLTILKIIPMMFLMNFPSYLNFIVGWGAFILASLNSVFSSNLKNLIIWSSLYFIGMLVLALKSTNFWLDLLILYTLMLAPLIMMFLMTSSTSVSTSTLTMGTSSSIMLALILINFSGLPPFPGFFLKLSWMWEMCANFQSLLVFVLSSALMVFMYLSFTLKNLSGMSDYLSYKPAFLKTSMLFSVLVLMMITLAASFNLLVL